MVAFICLSIILILMITYGIWMIYNIKTQKETKYKYRCTQPDTARNNKCGHLGFDGKCLMPYSGCNHQRMENEM